MNFWTRRSERDRLEDEGVPVTVPGYEGWTFYVRPKDNYNPHYARAVVLIAQQPDVSDYLKRLSAKGYAPTAEQSAEDDEIDRAMEVKAFAHGVLAKWSGVTDTNGAPISFSPDEAVKLLSHFQRDIYRHLVRFASTPENFVPKSDEEKEAAIEGNLERALPSSRAVGTARSQRAQRKTAGRA